jgi:hypothetical protein
MEIPFLLFFSGTVLFWAVLHLFKQLRMMIQGNREIRNALAARSFVVLEIRGAKVFRDCGSVREAFLSMLSIRDYHIRCRTVDGIEHTKWVEVEFHPISGAFREMRIVDGECEKGEPKEPFSGV